MTREDWKTRAVDLERETSVFERDGTVGDPDLPAGTAALPHGGTVDLDTVFPAHNPGPWPAGLSLRREDLYDDRGRSALDVHRHQCPGPRSTCWKTARM